VVLRVATWSVGRLLPRLLGCAVEKWQPELGLLQLRAGSALIDLVTLDGRSAAKRFRSGSRGLILITSAFASSGSMKTLLREPSAAYASKRAKPPTAMREGYGASIYIRDPDGNTVELKAPASLCWLRRGRDPPSGLSRLPLALSVSCWRWPARRMWALPPARRRIPSWLRFSRARNHLAFRAPQPALFYSARAIQCRPPARVKRPHSPASHRRQLTDRPRVSGTGQRRYSGRRFVGVVRRCGSSRPS